MFCIVKSGHRSALSYWTLYRHFPDHPGSCLLQSLPELCKNPFYLSQRGPFAFRILRNHLPQEENPERRTVISLLNQNFRMLFRGGIGGMRFNDGQALLAVQGNLRFGKRMGFIKKKQMIIRFLLHAPDDSPENRDSLLRRKWPHSPEVIAHYAGRGKLSECAFPEDRIILVLSFAGILL